MTFYDITRDYEKPFPGEQPFFTDILSDIQKEDSTVGLNGIHWYASLYPNLYIHKDRLVYRFDKKYAYREIGAETISRWMNLLQNRFDEIADKFNHAYKMYDDPNIDIDALTLGFKRSIESSSTGSGSNSSTSSNTVNSKFKDTPTSGTSTINNPTTENIDTENGTNSGSHNSQGNIKTTENYDYHDEHSIDEVNKIINHYKQIDEEFINEFNQMFIGILSKM